MATQQRIVLGVGGGIAAYKVASLLRLFKEAGHHVDVVPTRSALEFVGKATWEALSGRPVTADVFDAVDTVNHVRLGQEADLVVVAPATADVLARAAAGLANDLLTNTLLAARCPVVFAPAMHTEMWEHPATRANVATLRERGSVVVEPAVGRLTGKDSGAGRLPEPADLFAAVADLLAAAPGPRDGAASRDDDAAGSSSGPVPRARGPLAGRTVVVTAGGTREPLDPVRFLGNRSSGKQGIAIARAALAAGAKVRFVAAHMDDPAPEGVELAATSTALELREAVNAAAEGADVLVMAAAVADFRPAEYAASKIKKGDDGGAPTIELVRNPDILAELVARRNAEGQRSRLPRLVVGFAAETGDAAAGVLEHGHAKLSRKGCELLVVNQVGEKLVFGTDRNSVTVLSADGSGPRRFEGTKDRVAAGIVGIIGAQLSR
ncbi:MAG: bifunctional phosphopantothenoylcysteine decarboxylase/phosphopantothenate synthase [Arthrobacter sp.]|uniref:bifunctional phosphopantothenoylcysteine decarboxylase/phosphopantothenate synthase n=1 Tax=Arthrobacter sp. TaxID=1667 RepID=UPI003494A1EF